MFRVFNVNFINLYLKYFKIKTSLHFIKYMAFNL